MVKALSFVMALCLIAGDIVLPVSAQESMEHASEEILVEAVSDEELTEEISSEDCDEISYGILSEETTAEEDFELLGEEVCEDTPDEEYFLMDEGNNAAADFKIDGFEFKLTQKPFYDEDHPDYDGENDNTLDVRTIHFTPRFFNSHGEEDNELVGEVVPVRSDAEDVIYIKDGKMIAKNVGSSVVKFRMAVGDSYVEHKTEIIVRGFYCYGVCLTPGESFKFKMYYWEDLAWKSLNEELVTVNQDGIVTVSESISEELTGDALNTTVSAIAGDGTVFTFDVHIRIPVTGIEAYGPDGIMWMNGTWSMNQESVKYSPANTSDEYKDFYVESEDESIVGVESDEYGLNRVLVAKRPGVAKIHIKNEYGQSGEETIEVVGVCRDGNLIYPDGHWMENPEYNDGKSFYYIKLYKYEQGSTQLTFSDTKHSYNAKWGARKYDDARETYEDDVISVDSEGNVSIKDSVTQNTHTVLTASVPGLSGGMLGYEIYIDVVCVGITPSDCFLQPGDTQQFELTDGTNLYNATWSVSDNNAATIDSKGKLTVKAAPKSNSVKVYAKHGGNTFVADVNIGIPVSSISVPSQIYIKKGDYFTPDVTHSPSYATDYLGWSMKPDEGDILEFISHGWVDEEHGICRFTEIHALNTGTANVQIETDNGKTATFKVTVLDLSIDDAPNGNDQTFDLYSYIDDEMGETKTTAQLKITDGTNVYPATWVSENRNVASVNSNGLVTAVPSGMPSDVSRIVGTYKDVEFDCFARVTTRAQNFEVKASRNVLEVWEVGAQPAFDHNIDYPKLIGEPAGIVHSVSDDTFCNISWDIEAGEGYPGDALIAPYQLISVERDDDGNIYVEGKYDEVLKGEGAYGEDFKNGAPVVVKFTLTSQRYEWDDDGAHSVEGTVTTKEVSVPYLVKMADYQFLDRSYEGWDQDMIYVLSGTKELSQDDMSDGEINHLKTNGWQFADKDLSNYDGQNYAQVAIVRKNDAGEIIQQDYVGVQFINKPDFFPEVTKNTIPYYDVTNLKRTKDYAGTAVRYSVHLDDRANFFSYDPENTESKYTFDVELKSNGNVLKADDEIKAYYGWEGNGYNGIGEDLNDGKTIKFFRADKVGTGTIEAKLVIKDRASGDEVASIIKNITVKAIKSGNKGELDWSQTSTNVVKVSDSKKPYEGIDDANGLAVLCLGEDLDKYAPKGVIEAPYSDYCNSIDDDWTHYLTVGKTYAVMVDVSDEYNEFAPSDFAVKSSDAGVLKANKAKVVKAKVGGVEKNCLVMPFTVVRAGFAQLIVAAGDDTKSSMTIGVRTKDAFDASTYDVTKFLSLSNKTFTINRQMTEEFQMQSLYIKHSFGSPKGAPYDLHLIKAYLDGNSETTLPIYWSGEGGDNIGIIGSAGKHVLHLEYGRYEDVTINDGEPEGVGSLDTSNEATFNIAIKDSKKIPSVKVKQTQKLNTTYQNVINSDSGHLHYSMSQNNSNGVFKITAGGEFIFNVDVYNAQGVQLKGPSEENDYKDYDYDPNNGLLYLYTYPGKKMSISIYTDRYQPITKKGISVGTTSSKFVASAKSGTILTDTGDDGGMDFNDTRLFLQITDKSTKLPVEFLNRNDGDNLAPDDLFVYTECTTTKGNLNNKYMVELDYDRLIIKPAFTNTAPAEKGDTLKIGVKLPEWKTIQYFTYTVKGTSINKKTSLVVGSKSLTLYNYTNATQDWESSVHTSLSFGGGVVSARLDDVTVSEVVGKGKDPVLGTKLNAWIDSYNGTVTFEKKSEDLPAGKYTFKLEAQGFWAKKPSATIKLTVKNVDPISTGKGKGVQLTASAKGTIDVLDRDGTSLKITPKCTNVPKNVYYEYREITGQDAWMFDADCDSKGVVTLKLTQEAQVLKAANYTVKLKYFVQYSEYGNGFELETPAIKINMKQGKVKSNITWDSNFSNNQNSEWKNLYYSFTNSSGYPIEVKEMEIPETVAGFYSESAENNEYRICHVYDGSSVAGKKYKLKLNVYLQQAFVDSKPITVNLTANLAK